MALTQIAFDFDAFGTPEPVTPPAKKVEQPAVAVTPPPVIPPPIEIAPVMEEVVPEPVEVAPAVATRVKKVSLKKDTRGRKSLTEAAAGAALVQIPPDEELFSKAYYSMGQVSAMFNVTPSLLRLWENEFDVLKPRKNGKGDRLFRPDDVKMLRLIYHLVRERKYTMQGAKEFIKANAKAAEKSTLIEELKQLKAFLFELKASL